MVVAIGLLLEYRSGYFIGKKKFVIRIDEALPIVDILPGWDKVIEVTLDGQPANDLSIIRISIGNEGKKSIQSSDFETPIKLNFDNKIMGWSVINAKPPDLKIRVQEEIEPQSKNTLIVSPLLLNHEDRFELRVILLGKNLIVRPSVRIVDVKEIDLRNSTEAPVGSIRRRPESSIILLIVFVGIIMSIGLFLFVSLLIGRSQIG